MCSNCAGTFNNNIPIDNEKLTFHVHIGKCSTHHLTIEPHAFATLWKAGKWNMNFAILRYELINYVWILLVLILFNKPFDDSLLLSRRRRKVRLPSPCFNKKLEAIKIKSPIKIIATVFFVA